ncbi:ubiquinone biosynthesis protein coq-8 [Westerdykella ornata]|uniref:Ubiquinone biosynthesis protein coq-8 n=1 Tax=Westerdykella ornata TaxID=318751 RepID=A0A6A6J922_WESOR|nr:ubiquinone biosynthesis protein coq-8 [Westerdykella ornata]KAF2272777.1 ubiquinone biosynthesis protein coq-8 [Westerdykella ornata]
MAGRRLVDVARLFQASKSIAAKHINLRSQQFDVYSKTSSLAKAVKSQTDRVTLTAQAAVALAKRVNEEPPSYAPEAESRASRNHNQVQPQRRTTAEPPAKDELNIIQKEAEREPLADGTIPPVGAPLEQWGTTTEKEPSGTVDSIREGHTQRPQSGSGRAAKDGIQPVASAASTIPTPSDFTPLSTGGPGNLQLKLEAQIPSRGETIQAPPRGSGADEIWQPKPSSLPQKAANPEQDQLPEGINTDVFRTKRVSQMLNPYARKPRLDIPRAAERPFVHIKSAKGPDQNTINVHRIDQTKPSQPAESAPSTQKVTEQEVHDFASELAMDAQASPSPISGEIYVEPYKTPFELRESRVPSSRFGRFWQYAGLGTSMALGAVGESLRRVTGGAASVGGSLMLSPRNLEILVSKLSRMRGAALKLGQMISIQDMKMIPPEIHHVLQRVQDSADYMPASQRDKVLADNLGTDWRDLFSSFQEVPIAAASIGQVHKAVLRSTNTPVAVKVQYPGVANSIDSDLSNLSLLLTASRLLPKGLYLDKTIANARTELAWECDYTREAECQTRFRELLADDTDVFLVPKVYPEASGPSVLTAEFMSGIGVAKLPSLSQQERDWIGTHILRLCLREIVEFKFMQTDPNWTNFLYNQGSKKIELLDFGASRDYPDEFVGPYVDVLIAASRGDKQRIRDLSIQLGYLTGEESQIMTDAHIQSVLTLAEPFRGDGPDVYDFRDQTITDRVRGLIPVMVRERLAPPPEETYSLHRKLSGAFLLCARLGSRVPCRELFSRAVETWQRGGRVSSQ